MGDKFSSSIQLPKTTPETNNSLAALMQHFGSFGMGRPQMGKISDGNGIVPPSTQQLNGPIGNQSFGQSATTGGAPAGFAGMNTQLKMPAFVSNIAPSGFNQPMGFGSMQAGAGQMPVSATNPLKREVKPKVPNKIAPTKF